MTDAAPDPRSRLRDLATGRGVSYAALSRLIGRNSAYIQQFMERGTPKSLDENDRLRLAQFFRIDERELGACDPWSPDAPD